MITPTNLRGTLTAAIAFTVLSAFAQADIEIKNDGDLKFLDSQSSIIFPEATDDNPPMIYMFDGGINNPDRLILGHSPAYSNWGLMYHDTLDVFQFIGAGNRLLTIHPLSGKLGVGMSEVPSWQFQVHANTGPSYLRVSDNTTGISSGVRLGLNGSGSAYLINDYSSASLNFGTEGTTKLVLEADGDLRSNERIGATGTSPSFPFDARSNAFDRIGYFYNDRASSNTTFGIYAGAFGTGSGNKRGGSFDAVNGTGENVAVRAIAQNGNTNIGVYSSASGGSQAWAAHFDAGDVRIDDHVAIGGSNPQAGYPLYVSESGASNSGSAFFYNSVNSTNTNFGLVTYGYNSGTGAGYGLWAAGTDFGVYCVGNEYVSGDLRIGTSADVAGYRLSVNGDAICEEIKVQNSINWPDYVFDADYQLMSLPVLKEEIDKRGHLPGMPSAEQVRADNGIEVGEMQKRLLEKVEELTLYVIDLNEQNQQMREELNALKAKLDGAE